MWQSLQRLSRLPEETRVYPGHNYGDDAHLDDRPRGAQQSLPPLRDVRGVPRPARAQAEGLSPVRTATRATAPVVASERLLVFLVGAVQFVNILDFMMVMPLGPDFARALGIPDLAPRATSAAATRRRRRSPGLVGALFLDRFDRRKALGRRDARAGDRHRRGRRSRTGLGTLMLARVLAGAFGGPGDVDLAVDHRRRRPRRAARPRDGRGDGRVLGGVGARRARRASSSRSGAAGGCRSSPSPCMGVVIVVLGAARDAADARPHRRDRLRPARGPAAVARCSPTERSGWRSR